MNEGSVLAMYDIRGIQNYIFRTSKVKEAMGASDLIENIVAKALDHAVSQAGCKEQAALEWYSAKGYLTYEEDGSRVKVLFVGGGNAYVMFESEELCIIINRYMAKYVLEQTYSLQLAAAFVPYSGRYKDDYGRLRREMERVKASMAVTRPYGALPVMKTELETGYPVTRICQSQEIGTETFLKWENKKKLHESELDRLIENLREKKGVDSMIAVVHIDGNNMGLRIRELLGDAEDYEQAVNQMRKLSYHIRKSFQTVFHNMNDLFEGMGDGLTEKQFVRKILAAGDDITYVCRAKIALATVEYFCKEIGKMTMTGGREPEDIRRYGFSVCAGVAFMGIHFPFSAAYETAEQCCESAKLRAKQPEHMDGGRVGSFVDFHICQNVQARDLEAVRQKEYVTYTGESLLRRPYAVPVSTDSGEYLERMKKEGTLQEFKSYIRYFRDKNNIPSSLAKEIRNTYPLGRFQMKLLTAFLASRDIKMPDGTLEMYRTDKDGCLLMATWYDALEMMDCCADLEDITGGKEGAE